jgi:hypothetical protein
MRQVDRDRHPLIGRSAVSGMSGRWTVVPADTARREPTTSAILSDRVGCYWEDVAVPKDGDGPPDFAAVGTDRHREPHERLRTRRQRLAGETVSEILWTALRKQTTRTAWVCT